MDKSLILAVAGSGKTRHIVDKLNLDHRALLVTYTDNNTRTLQSRITQKFGHLPPNIRIYSYFTFLHSFAFKPLLSLPTAARGINWNVPPSHTLKLPRSDPQFYMDGQRRLYHNRIAKLLEEKGALDELNERLRKYFDCVYIDEIQDIAGHDFNLLTSICRADLNFLLVGDFFQHTFDTSRDGPVNKNLHNDYKDYIGRFKKIGVKEDRTTLSSSYRCTPSVCRFISDELGIAMSSHRTDDTEVRLIEDAEEAEDYFNRDETVKLFYETHYRYPCFSQNWGNSKGQDCYEDVCVVLSKQNVKRLRENTLRELAPKTRNKLYVACSRAKGDLIFLNNEHIKKHKKG